MRSFWIVVLGLFLAGVFVWQKKIDTDLIDKNPIEEHHIPEKKVTVDPDLHSVPVPIREINVLATNWYFEPEMIHVKLGERIRLIVTSEGRAHGLSLPVFGIEAEIPLGDTQTFEFVADQIGTFPFSCPVYCGDGHTWMTGTLIVEK